VNNARLHVTVWGENLHERRNTIVQTHYPRGMHTTIAEGTQDYLGERRYTATLEQREHSLTEDVRGTTDVLARSDHIAHAGVDDSVVDRGLERVLLGMA
jgi:trehalose utilization protein